jgi:hypothetical protein
MRGVSGFRRKPSIPQPLVLTTIWIAAVSGEIALLFQQMGGGQQKPGHTPAHRDLPETIGARVS